MPITQSSIASNVISGATGPTGPSGANGTNGSTGATGGTPWTISGANTYFTGGSVGVNNTSPGVLTNTTQVAVKANVNGDSMFVAQNSNGLTTAKFGFQYTGSIDNPVIGSQTNHPFVFLTNNTERMRIDSAGCVTTPAQPAFCVGISGTVTASGVMVFNVTSGSGGAAIFFNRGSHYNSSNGRFTAPVAGAYQFNFMALLTGGSNAWVEVNTLLNGTISQQFRRETTGADNTTANYNSIIYMNANDYLQISISAFGGSSPTFQANDSRVFTSFSGVLLG